MLSMSRRKLPLNARNNILFDHVFVEKLWHDSHGNASTSSLHYTAKFFIFQSDDVLAINFEEVVISQQAVTGSRRVLNQTGDASIFVSKTYVPKAIFVKSNATFERSAKMSIDRLLKLHHHI